MNAKLKEMQTRMETEHKALFKELHKYPDDLLNKKPAPDAWSVVQVLKHLITADGYSLEYLRKKLASKDDVRNEGLQGLYKSVLLKLIFLTPLKFKSPKVVNPDAEFTTLAQLEAQWTEIRRGIAEVTKQMTDEQLSKGYWKHARAGKMNIYQMFDFLHIHFTRHQKQIERTLKAVK